MARRLNLLEDMLDTRLFDRSQQGLTLTPPGEALLPYAERMEAELAGAQRAIGGQDARVDGVVHVSVAPFMVDTKLGDHIASFAAAHPEIEIALQTTNRVASLQRHEVDVSIRYAADVSGDIIGTALARCTKAVYCSAETASKMQDNGGAGLSILGWNEPEDARTADWVTQTPYPNATLSHRLIDGGAQTLFAARGLGLSILPCFYGDAQTNLVRAPFQQPIPDRTLWLLFHKDIRDTARVRLFIDAIVAAVRQDTASFNVTTFNNSR